MKKLLLLTICTVMCGCSTYRLSTDQKAQIEQLSVASTILNRQTSDEFKETRDYVIRLNKMRQSVNPNWPMNGGLDGALESDAIRQRITAVTSLETYSVLLYALVTDQEDSAIRNASQRFLDSLNRVETIGGVQTPPVGESVIDKSIRSIGRFFVERKKYTAIKEIVQSSQAHVDAICDLIIADFEGDKGLTAQLVVTATGTKLDADSFLRLTEPVKENVNLGRKDAVDAYDVADLGIQRHGIVHHRIARLAYELKQLNRELHTSLQKDAPKLSVESLEAFRIGVERLIDDAKYYTR